MPFKLDDVDIDDFDELIACLWESYENPYQPFFRLFCPIVGTGPTARAEALEASTSRQLAWHRSDPSSHWQKVTDTDTGKIIAGALWKTYKTNPFEKPEDNDPDWYPEGSRRDFVKQAIQQLDSPRAQLAQRPHLYLNILYTHPDFRRRGAGDLVLEWGTKKADELGLEMWIDATFYGVPLYKKHGFQVVRENNLRPQTETPDNDWRKIEEELMPLTIWPMFRPIGGKYVDGQTVRP